MPRLRIALCVLALFSGCTSVRPLDVGGSSREAEGLPVLAIDEGILVLDIRTEVPIEALKMGLVTAVSALPAGEHLLFLGVSEGEHRWTEVVVQRPRGDIRYAVPTSEAYAFRVERGRISYSGAISVRAEARSGRLSFSIRSRSAEVLAALRKSHPALVERFPPTDPVGARYREPPPRPGTRGRSLSRGIRAIAADGTAAQKVARWPPLPETGAAAPSCPRQVSRSQRPD